MKHFIFVITLIIVFTSCKKNDNEPSMKDTDYIDISIDNINFHKDSSYYFTTFGDVPSSSKYADFGFMYRIDSVSEIEIGIGTRNNNSDYDNCQIMDRLKKKIFYKLFEKGNYNYRSYSYINELIIGETFVSISYIIGNTRYWSLRNDIRPPYSNSSNSFKINQIEIIKDGPDCQILSRVLRIKGEFECYVYRGEPKIGETSDSIKLVCKDFIGTINY